MEADSLPDICRKTREAASWLGKRLIDRNFSKGMHPGPEEARDRFDVSRNNVVTRNVISGYCSSTSKAGWLFWESDLKRRTKTNQDSLCLVVTV